MVWDQTMAVPSKRSVFKAHSNQILVLGKFIVVVKLYNIFLQLERLCTLQCEMNWKRKSKSSAQRRGFEI